MIHRAALTATLMLCIAVTVTVSVAVDPADDVAQWDDQLRALSPDAPQSYFLLAEEVADASSSGASQALATRLFSLAALLAPDRYARSACLALAQLETEQHQKRRLLAAAYLLDDTPAGSTFHNAGQAQQFALEPATALAISEAFSFHRRGLGDRARRHLTRRDGLEVLEQLDALPGGADRFLHETRTMPTGASRQVEVDDPRLVAQLHLETALLAGESRSWSADHVLSRGQPLVEVDPDQLEQLLGIDATRPYYRDGRWVQRP